MTVSTIAKPQVGPDPQRAEVDRPRQPLDPPDIGSVSADVFRRPIFLENNDSHLGAFQWTTQMVVKIVVRPISKLSEENRCHE